MPKEARVSGKRKQYIVVEGEQCPSYFPCQNAVNVSALRARVLEIQWMLECILRNPELLQWLSETANQFPQQERFTLPPVFVLKGNFWSFRFGVEEGNLKDTIGAKYVALLLASPNRPLSVSELLGIPQGEIAALIGRDIQFLDDRGLAALQTRLAELRTTRPRTPAEVEEIDDIEHIIRRDTWRGRSRNFRRPKSAVHAVRTAIRRFRESIDPRQFPKFREHLQYIHTAHPFIYCPPSGFPKWNKF